MSWSMHADMGGGGVRKMSSIMSQSMHADMGGEGSEQNIFNNVSAYACFSCTEFVEFLFGSWGLRLALQAVLLFRAFVDFLALNSKSSGVYFTLMFLLHRVC